LGFLGFFTPEKHSSESKKSFRDSWMSQTNIAIREEGRKAQKQAQKGPNSQKGLKKASKAEKGLKMAKKGPKKVQKRPKRSK